MYVCVIIVAYTSVIVTCIVCICKIILWMAVVVH